MPDRRGPARSERWQPLEDQRAPQSAADVQPRALRRIWLGSYSMDVRNSTPYAQKMFGQKTRDRQHPLRKDPNSDRDSRANPQNRILSSLQSPRPSGVQAAG